MSKNFFERLKEISKEKNTLLCVGLDPRVDVKEGESCIEKIVAFNKRIIEATAEFTLCYKPNSAFYEQYGPEGMVALEKTLEMIPEGIPVILDAKRNDIGATAKAYADATFGYYNVESVTLSPYMGKDSVDPFTEYEGRGVFMLCRTSNPSAGQLQDLTVDNKDLYLETARECVSWGDQVGLVVAGNDLEALNAVRSEFPKVWFLSPGIGAQGGTMEEAVSAGMDAEGFGILPVVARGIANADDPAKAAKEYRDALNIARDKALKGEAKVVADPLRKAVLKGLIDEKCFKTGEFTLKSGLKSPFYIDLRRIMSSPALLKKVARAYATLLKGLKCDRIAGIPVAGLPLATAVSLETGIPMIFPRMTMKAHGTGNCVEGEYQEGETVVLLDDLITTGKSKIEALDVLRGANLKVVDLIVLLERGVQGRKDMTEAGINLHSYAQVEELLEVCYELNLISEQDRDDMLAYAKN